MAQSEQNLFSTSRERKLIFLLCFFGAIHVFIFSAAFPFFNNMDERFHFDLVLRYSHGELPRGLESLSDETVDFTKIYASPEFQCTPGMFSDGKFPVPPWIEPSAAEQNPASLKNKQAIDAAWIANKEKKWLNYESSQQPVYYALAGVWCRLGQGCGLSGLQLLYWIRFLNSVFVALLVWIGYVAARMIFPENAFIRRGVPALIAFFPQQAFYSIQNDVLSPLSFGLVFIYLVRGAQMEQPDAKWGMMTGFALAMTFLVKLSNVPVLITAALAILIRAWHLHKNGKLRPVLPALVCLILCAGIPIAAWLGWTKYAFGDFTGTAAKIQSFTWTEKPFTEWWSHPIFTLQGVTTFVLELMTTFWQGEFAWHANPLQIPVANALYVIPALCFVGLGLMGALSRAGGATALQRQMLWFGFCCFVSGAGFLAFLSIRFDFGDCAGPSRLHPYFTAGRLVLASLIPFLLLYFYGLHHLFRGLKNRWLRPTIIVGIVVFVIILEIINSWPVFASQYNWYHSW
ncbi:MAG TPA: DUF2142 domain-containing protein [Candidatus Baltobacteraceae bacterium]|nr:DUF2142 domain-containing protein [Candidatus Baltobacteraceae bacterium]